MESLKVFILGVVQGLTEFLPVSSSGHLVLFQNAFGMTEPEILLDVGLHVGTLTAVCAVFHKELWKLMSTFFRLPSLLRETGGPEALFSRNTEFRTLTLIAFANLPTAILGLYFKSHIETLFGTARVTGFMLLVTGLLLFFTRKLSESGRSIDAMKIRDALIIGFAQGLAILPGLSRSGATISIALFLGIRREVAGPFSFLLSIPAILGALFLEVSSPLTPSPVSVKMLLLGSATAVVIGFFALKILIRFVNQGRLMIFAPYCWGVGILTLLLNG